MQRSRTEEQMYPYGDGGGRRIRSGGSGGSPRQSIDGGGGVESEERGTKGGHPQPSVGGLQRGQRAGVSVRNAPQEALDMPSGNRQFKSQHEATPKRTREGDPLEHNTLDEGSRLMDVRRGTVEFYDDDGKKRFSLPQNRGHLSRKSPDQSNGQYFANENDRGIALHNDEGRPLIHHIGGVLTGFEQQNQGRGQSPSGGEMHRGGDGANKDHRYVGSSRGGTGDGRPGGTNVVGTADDRWRGNRDNGDLHRRRAEGKAGTIDSDAAQMVMAGGRREMSASFPINVEANGYDQVSSPNTRRVVCNNGSGSGNGGATPSALGPRLESGARSASPSPKTMSDWENLQHTPLTVADVVVTAAVGSPAGFVVARSGGTNLKDSTASSREKIEKKTRNNEAPKAPRAGENAETEKQGEDGCVIAKEGAWMSKRQERALRSFLQGVRRCTFNHRRLQNHQPVRRMFALLWMFYFPRFL